jgi:hypothetical protein
VKHNTDSSDTSGESSSSRRPGGGTWAGPATLPAPQPDQCWQHWPIRLYKATKSVKLFGCNAEFESLRKFGRARIDRGEKMHYLRDLSWLFRG